jgi:integrase
MRVELKGLHAVKSKRGKGVYYYAWRGGPRIKTDSAPGTAAFMQAYNAAIASAQPPAKQQVSELIALYRGSTEFTGLSARTQSDYLKQIKVIEVKFGGMPLVALESPRARGLFKEWRDNLAKRSLRQADYAWSVLQRILSVAKDRGKITTNPCERGGRLYTADRTDHMWTDDDVVRFLKQAPAHLHLALLLALWTGQRQGDLLRLPWSAYDGACIKLRQSKGGRRVKVPVGMPLKAMLDASPRVATVILATVDKTAWTEDGFRSSWGKACGKAGIRPGLTFHDLRGSAVTRLAEAGCSVPEIATVTGHSLADVEEILDAHYMGRTTKLAESSIAKLERAAGVGAGINSERNL